MDVHKYVYIHIYISTLNIYTHWLGGDFNPNEKHINQNVEVLMKPPPNFPA